MGHVKLLDGQNNVTYKSRWKKEGFFLEALFYGKAMLILEVSVVLFKLGEAIATQAMKMTWRTWLQLLGYNA